MTAVGAPMLSGAPLSEGADLTAPGLAVRTGSETGADRKTCTMPLCLSSRT